MRAANAAKRSHLAYKVDQPCATRQVGVEHAVVYRTRQSHNGGNADNFVYVDFIHNEKSKGLITQDIAKLLIAKIDFLSCRTDCSGPKEEEAIEYFSKGAVDFGRM